MIRDAKGKMIETVNHERLNCTRPHVMPTLEISRYERYPWNPNVNFTHANHLNSLPFWGAPPKHALLRPITCEYVQLEVIDGQKEWFCKTSYKIDFDFKADSEEPWKLKVLHYGNYVRESLSNSNIIQAVDVQGRPRQVNLDLDGFELSSFVEGPCFLEFDQYDEADFNQLGINADQLGFRIV